MEKLTFEDIRNRNLLLYSYLRGSHCQGLATETSDFDYGGIYMSPIEQLVGLGLDYQEQIANNTNDIVWYELNRFMNLLLKSNPTVLEALFVDDKYIEYEHPIMTEIKSHRDKFLTKKCFDSFFGYAKQQVRKARGLNKKINWQIPERKGILDFVYTFYNQGSTKFVNWLDYRNLKQEYCGLVKIPNMPTMMGVYYDWGNFFLHEGITYEDMESVFNDPNVHELSDIVSRIKEGEEGLDEELRKSKMKNMVKFIIDTYKLSDDDSVITLMLLKGWYNLQEPIGYKGLVNEANTSNELRLSSVTKGEKPLCHISFYSDAYTQHCRVWKEYEDWKKHRNPVRYESNLNKSYDAKNMAHCFRLMSNGIEIARGEGYKVDRTGIDADFILKVKNHGFEYDELIDMLDEKSAKMEEAMANSTIPDDIDSEFVNDLLLSIRRRQSSF